MLTLYIKTGCPYCKKVLEKVDELEIEIEKKNILDEGVSEELIELGGKQQVPFLIDSEKNVQMYESDDISKYLDTYHSEHGGKENSNQ